MRKKAAASARIPHEDPRIEAQIRQVESRYAAIRRTEERLADITEEQQSNGERLRTWAEDPVRVQSLESQATSLRNEHASLEEFISQAHREVTEILAALGDSALYLGALS